MADLITFADNLKVTGTISTSTKQDIKQAVDVSGYDRLDLQISLWGQNGGGNGIKVTILTSMQNTSDDASWVSAGQTATLNPANPPGWGEISVPTTGLVLLRYVRYSIDFESSTTSVNVSIRGLARRGSL